MGTAFTKFKGWWTTNVNPWFKTIASWILSTFEEATCSWVSLFAGLFGAYSYVKCKLGIDKPKENECDSPDPEWKDVCDILMYTIEGLLAFMSFVVILMTLYFFFPFFTGLYDLIQVAFDFVGYGWDVIGEAFGGFTLLWASMMALGHSLETSVGGLPILWFMLVVELLAVALTWVGFEFSVGYHYFQNSPFAKVFYVLNTPFRLIRTEILQALLGKPLGAFFSFPLVPFEMVAFMFSIPAGLVYWLGETLLEGKRDSGVHSP